MNVKLTFREARGGSCLKTIYQYRSVFFDSGIPYSTVDMDKELKNKYESNYWNSNSDSERKHWQDKYNNLDDDNCISLAFRWKEWLEDNGYSVCPLITLVGNRKISFEEVEP